MAIEQMENKESSLVNELSYLNENSSEFSFDKTEKNINKGGFDPDQMDIKESTKTFDLKNMKIEFNPNASSKEKLKGIMVILAKKNKEL
ncbi:MAG: hypothetical protein GXP45_01290 [bacterium]|nr:hypothetical protein [bacterium]